MFTYSKVKYYNYKQKRKTTIYTSKPEKLQFALKLRNNPTPTEILLWKRLVGRQIKNNVFVRQKVIMGWIVDFYSSHSRVAIELDGKMHDPIADHKRDIHMNDVGIYVLRFTNDDIYDKIDWVLEKIAESLRVAP